MVALIAVYWIGFLVTAVVVVARGMGRVWSAQAHGGTGAGAGIGLLISGTVKSLFWPIVWVMAVARRS